MTFRVALHYVRPDNYHVFMSCDFVVELGLLDGTRLVTCPDSFVLLRAYSLGIEITFWSFGNRIFALV